jgi:hypothetical protein
MVKKILKYLYLSSTTTRTRMAHLPELVPTAAAAATISTTTRCGDKFFNFLNDRIKYRKYQ